MYLCKSWSKRMSTWILNGWLRDALVTAAPARVGNKTLKGDTCMYVCMYTAVCIALHGYWNRIIGVD